MAWLAKNRRNCRMATFLVEKQLFMPLSTSEKLRLKLHLRGCPWCKTYLKQSGNIQLLMHNVFTEAMQGKLDEQFKDGLQVLIKEKLKNKYT